jgi:hypothetical protein
MGIGKANGVDRFVVSRARTLGDACREAGRDEDGRRCAHCPLKDLCMSEERWFVKRYARRPYQN